MKGIIPKIIEANSPGHSIVQMPTIRIENFGPVKYFESEVKDIMFFIGPQASGKSTISKAIFFFKSLPEELLKWIYDATPEDLEPPIIGFAKHLQKRFVDYFGTTRHLQPFLMEYSYANDKTIKLNLNEGYVQVNFSQTILDELNTIFRMVRDYSTQLQQQVSSNTLKDLLERDAERRNYFKSLEKHLHTLFAETRNPVFIPAGRNLLSTLADQIQNINPHSLDGFTKSFVDRINNLKPVFKDNLRALVEDKKRLTTTKIEFEQVYFAIKVITNILKGEYRCDAEGEKIYFSDQEYTRLQYSSSGQQEAIWILLLTFKLVLDQEEVFVVFEEPEAHLYPEAQNDIVELIGLLANARPTNQIVITTHSPYILTAFNNLLYAHQLGQSKPAQVANVFNPQVWIAANRVAAYFVANGQCQSILDEELNQLQAEKVDGASSLTNEKYDKLFELDD